VSFNLSFFKIDKLFKTSIPSVVGNTFSTYANSYNCFLLFPFSQLYFVDKFAGGYAEDISEEQFDLLKKFLAQCPADQIEEMRFPSEPVLYFGCRILRARKYDLADALKLVQLTSTWRREKRVRAIAENDPYEILGIAEDELLFYYPKTYFPLPDAEGRPIYAEKGGLADVEAMMMLVDGDMAKMVDYHIYGNEMYMRNLFGEMTVRAGKPVHTITTIMDMEGMSMKMIGTLSTSYIAAMIGIDKEHYPETLGKMIFINVPSFFSIGFAMIKPFLDERTVRKIEILAGPSEWKPKLNELVGANNLPVEFGGKCEVKGGIYPKSRTENSLLRIGKVMNVFAEAKKGETVRFKWFCRPADICMGVTFVPAKALPPLSSSPETATDVILPKAPGEIVLKEIVDHPGSDTKFIEDTHKAPEDGYFVATFDNRKGWYDRHVYHRFDKLVEVNGKLRPECAAPKQKS
jgi:hypothetical protein